MQLSVKQRFQIIFLHEIGKTKKTIAHMMGVNKNTVTKWLQEYSKNKTVELPLVDRKKRKCKRKTNHDQDMEIIQELKNNNYLTASNIAEIVKEKNINVSTSTINNRLYQYGFRFRIPAKKPLLTAKHKFDRLTWAIHHIDTDWSKILFSDETTIRKGPGNRKRWIRMKNNDYEKTVKHDMKMHAWGCINSSGIKRIHIFDGIMDSQMYTEILTGNLLQIIYNDNSLIFQDDNDPKHTSKHTIEWKKFNEIKYIDWPANSPDLNPIENIWALLKLKMTKLRPLTKTQFVHFIEESWKDISSKVISKTINSMQKRIIDVINNNGDLIDY